MAKQTFSVQGEVWLYPGKAGWHFLTVPQNISEEIDYYHSLDKRGWGSLPVTVKLGNSQWQTSIFPDRKSHGYVLPIKSEIRHKETLKAGDRVLFNLEVRGK